MLYLSSSTHNTSILFYFFFNDTATTEIYTLSLHDALPICSGSMVSSDACRRSRWKYCAAVVQLATRMFRDRKSTRLNSSHSQISYAVFCLKKKKNKKKTQNSKKRNKEKKQ